MDRIAFYLNNKSIKNIDLSNAQKYNPGIGGSEWICINTCAFYSELDLDSRIILLLQSSCKLPQSVNYVVVGSLENACRFAEKEMFDYLVVDSKILSRNVVRRHPFLNIISWANNDIEEVDYVWYEKYKNIKKIICVGDAEKNRLMNTSIYNKSIVIYPLVPQDILNEYKSILPVKCRQHNVVYAGSLIESKGFGELAKIWKSVIAEVPDAELYVIGSGQLYNRDNKLGKWGITHEPFESEIMSSLCDDSNTLLPSVHFLGILGREKYDIFSNCKVGVPNPCGETETFCITAIEMQMMGCLITTIRKGGFLSSVADQKSLYTSIEQLHDYIVKLLKTGDSDYEMITRHIINFSPERIIVDWQKMFKELSSSNYLLIRRVLNYLFYVMETAGILKFIRKIIRISSALIHAYLH